MSNLPKVAKVTIKTESDSPWGLKFSIVIFQVDTESPAISSANEFVLHFTNGKTYPPDNANNQNPITGASEVNGEYFFPKDFDNLFQGTTNWLIEKIEYRESSNSHQGWQALPGDPSFEYENETPFEQKAE